MPASGVSDARRQAVPLLIVPTPASSMLGICISTHLHIHAMHYCRHAGVSMMAVNSTGLSKTSWRRRGIRPTRVGEASPSMGEVYLVAMFSRVPLNLRVLLQGDISGRDPPGSEAHGRWHLVHGKRRQGLSAYKLGWCRVLLTGNLFGFAFSGAGGRTPMGRSFF